MIRKRPTERKGNVLYQLTQVPVRNGSASLPQEKGLHIPFSLAANVTIFDLFALPTPAWSRIPNRNGVSDIVHPGAWGLESGAS